MALYPHGTPTAKDSVKQNNKCAAFPSVGLLVTTPDENATTASPEMFDGRVILAIGAGVGVERSIEGSACAVGAGVGTEGSAKPIDGTALTVSAALGASVGASAIVAKNHVSTALGKPLASAVTRT